MPADPINSIITGVFFGILAAVLLIFYNKMIIGKFIKALVRAEALHEDDCKSFDEIDCKRNVFINMAMRPGGSLMRVVNSVKDNGTDKYFIPADKLYRAQRMYGGKDVDLPLVIVSIVVLIIAVALASILIPPFIEYVMGIFSSFGTQ